MEELEERIAPSALGNPGNNNPPLNNTNNGEGRHRRRGIDRHLIPIRRRARVGGLPGPGGSFTLHKLQIRQPSRRFPGVGLPIHGPRGGVPVEVQFVAH